MPLNNNFLAPARLDGKVLHVTGSSGALEGAVVISRHVALQQGTTVIKGPASLLPGEWAADLPLPASGIQAGDALGVAIETHFIESPAPSFVAVTWAQVVKVT